MPNKQNTISPEEKKILNKCYWGSLSCMRTTSNVVGQGRAMVLSTAPVIEKYYQDDEAKKEALTRHASEYINTNQTMYGLLAGIACAMEKERAEKGNVEPGTITSVIASLMGPLAGIGDSFFFNCVRVIVAGIAIGIAADGNLLGPLLFVALFGFGLLALKYVLFMTGYRTGTSLIDQASESGIISMLMEVAGILGAMMVGVQIASNIKINIALAPVVNGAEINIQGILDNVMPGLLSLVLWWGSYKALQKGLTPVKLIFIIMGGCILLSLVGIL